LRSGARREFIAAKIRQVILLEKQSFGIFHRGAMKSERNRYVQFCC